MNLEEARLQVKIQKLRDEWLATKETWRRQIIELQAKPLKALLKKLQDK